MLHKSSADNLQKHLVKAAVCATVVLGAFGLGESAYAAQYLYKVNITEFNCRGRTCTIRTTAGTNHAVTTATQSCTRGVFGWNVQQKPDISNTLFKAFISWTPISFRYSEYYCYEGGSDGFGRTMEFGDFNVPNQ
jgi:hypothetical protein